MKPIYTLLLPLMLLALTMLPAGCSSSDEQREAEVEKPVRLVYGIPADDYRLEIGEVLSGQTVGGILGNYGVTARTIDRLDRAAKKEFPLRNIRPGRKYTLFLRADSLAEEHLDYFVYEQNIAEYVVFGFVGDSITITKGEKPTTTRRSKQTATITSSLWGAIQEADLPYALAADLEDIYQWTIDFFSIREGDSFTVIYDERFIDDTISVGIGCIWGAKFTHMGKDIYAIPYKQGEKVQYWEADGASLRKRLLKAPLKFSRISSKFSYSRLHPVHKMRRPHTGVDYAAPSGTPVRAVADGVVTFRGWGGGGGNTIKIKHPGNLVTGYLHLSRFAKGIAVGKRVAQGDLIGYVGSTGTSTGPHLDYRIWKNGTPINPLTVPQEPTEPISAAHKERFEFVRDRIIAELEGTIAPDEVITQLDSVTIPAPAPIEEPAAESKREKRSKK